MKLTNRREKYGAVAKWLHWLTAICFLVAYIAFYYGHFFTEPRSPESSAARGFHTMFGISAGLLFLPRLFWRLRNVQPEEEPAPEW